jgi:hypothetical protein
MFDATDLTLSSIEAGLRPNASIVIYYHDTDDLTSVPIAVLPADFTGNGGDVVLQWHADGIFYIDGGDPS